MSLASVAATGLDEAELMPRGPRAKNWALGSSDRQQLVTPVHAAPLTLWRGKGPDKFCLSVLSTQPLPEGSWELPTHLPSPLTAVLHMAHACRLISNS